MIASGGKVGLRHLCKSSTRKGQAFQTVDKEAEYCSARLQVRKALPRQCLLHRAFTWSFGCIKESICALEAVSCEGV